MLFRRALAMLLATTLLLAGCALDEPGEEAEEQAEAPLSVTLRTAANDPQDPNIAVLEFLPEKVSVLTGTEVSWTFDGPEPHSVTFFPEGQTPPPPGSDPSLNEGNETEGEITGTDLVNSGLRPFGPEKAEDFKVTFSKAGRYNYVCVIHPLMTGQVTVVEENGQADTQDEITRRGDEEYERWLEEGRAAKQKLNSAPAGSAMQGGRTLWTVEMGATTEHTDILAFAPVKAFIKPGDRVNFINKSGAPHTATFAGGTELPQNPESTEAQNATPGASPQTLAKTGFYNTGWLPPNSPPGSGPPIAARTFSFEVPEVGDYLYVCLLHLASGMTGSISVT
ncbi:MAG TPA: plastocyanin/azurin family copper-binding protein [Actinomycetota bacterium]|nr:plastocyanin/azurin family copper-binding protein [Actinomycetota bacterium]